MLTINIKDNVLKLNNVDKNNLTKILNWYNESQYYKFATGIDSPISLNKLYQKYSEILVCKDEFFAEIYLNSNNDFIGVVRGGIYNKFHKSLWINSIIIDTYFQNMGYGSRTINIMSEYFKSNYNINHVFISVINKNIKAKQFWSKLGFVELRKMQNNIIIDNQKQEVTIMRKNLYSN